jgi:hypothetical protein
MCITIFLSDIPLSYTTVTHFHCLPSCVDVLTQSSENITYADIGQLDRPKPCKAAGFTVICDDDRIEYAQLNHNVLQYSMPLPSVGKSSSKGDIVYSII